MPLQLAEYKDHTVRNDINEPCSIHNLVTRYKFGSLVHFDMVILNSINDIIK